MNREGVIRLRRRALLAATLGLLVAFAGIQLDRTALLQAYLPAWLFCLGIGLGAVPLLALHRLTGGRWGESLRPGLEAAAATLPLILLLSLPILTGLRELYPWAGTAATPLVQGREWYLNVPFFLWRMVAWYALWLICLILLRPGPRAAGRAALALILYALSVTLFAVDLVMSLEPRFHSTVFGLSLAVGQMLGGLAFGVAVALFTAPVGEFATRRDLGNLLFAFVMLWAYLAYAQLLIIWYENLPREVVWYLPRAKGLWLYWGIGVAILHFMLPFTLLLFRGVKRRAGVLAAVALLLLGGRAADLIWLTLPSMTHLRGAVIWLYPASLLALAGLCLAFFTRHLESRLLSPPLEGEPESG